MHIIIIILVIHRGCLEKSNCFVTSDDSCMKNVNLYAWYCRQTVMKELLHCISKQSLDDSYYIVLSVSKICRSISS